MLSGIILKKVNISLEKKVQSVVKCYVCQD